MATKLFSFLFCIFSSIAFSQKLNYTIQSIPDSLKQNANAVIRFNQIDILITSQENMKITTNRIVSVYNEKGMGAIDASEGYDKRTKVTSIGATVFDENGKEWWTVEPKVIFDFKSEYDQYTAHHQATIVDMILKNGVKTIVVQDTAGIGTGYGEDNNLRDITPDMLAKRSYAMGFILDNDDEKLIPEPIALQPKFAQSKSMSVGSKGENVKQLQAVLIYEGVLKIKAPTGEFWGMTRDAVKKLQEKYKSEILTPVGLKYGTGLCGSSTLKFLNKKYA